MNRFNELRRNADRSIAILAVVMAVFIVFIVIDVSLQNLRAVTKPLELMMTGLFLTSLYVFFYFSALYEQVQKEQENNCRS